LRKAITHLGLFLLTFIATTLAGTEWTLGKFVLDFESGYTSQDFFRGLQFSVPFLAILTVHEFGHYFTAKAYKLKVSLPYYIPLWFGGLAPSIGTMGAFIRIKSAIKSRKQFFDVGVAGPLAGFVIAVFVITYGFLNLPDPEYIFEIHPEYEAYGLEYEQYVYEDLPEGTSLRMGTNLLFEFYKAFVATAPERIPNDHEIIHSPYLLAGFLACFFTALNLLPIGQLDGGHILFGLIGARRFKVFSPVFFAVFVFYGGLGLFSAYDFMGKGASDHLLWGVVYLFFLYWIFEKVFKKRRDVILCALTIFTVQFALKTIYPSVEGYNGWLLFAFLLGRVLGVYHPDTLYDAPLSKSRQIIGWFSLFVFLITFSPTPFIIE